MSTSARKRLRTWCDVLLDSESSPSQRLSVVTAFHKEVIELVGFAAETSLLHPSNVETILPSGKAISPAAAAHCVLDFERTTRFLIGVDRALVEMRERFPGERIRVLYAGCGPAAPLILPLTTRFRAEEIELMLVDVHPFSVAAVRRVVEHFDASEHLTEVVQGDACELSLAEEWRPRVVVVECLQRALTREPQVAVTGRLAPQIRDGGFLIPHRITVSACLLDPSREMTLSPSHPPGSNRRFRIDLGTVGELSAETATDFLAETHLVIPDDVPENLQLALLTQIEVVEGIVLGDYDSGLTCPMVLGEFAAGARVAVRYTMGADPGFSLTVEE